MYVVFGPDAVKDWRTAAELLAEAFAAHEVTGELVPTSDPAEFAAAVRAVADDAEFIVVPGSAALPDVADRQVIRVDFGRCPLDTAPGVRAHIRGRGLDGLRYAVSSWYFRRFHAPVVHTYGTHRQQWADLRMPPGPGPFPVAVLIHGGYWKPWWDADIMDALAVDLTARGYATWNIEYRRPIESDWQTMADDVAAAYAALADIPAANRLDLDRIVVVGHSAGGQLALRLVADAPTPRPALAVSLAGVLDLHPACERALGDNAVSMALGRRYSAEVHRHSSPIERLPIGIPQLVVVGLDDDPDLLEISRHYVNRATAAHDPVGFIELPGDHFAVIDPSAEIWRHTMESVSHTLGVGGEMSDSA
ncbi:alpha/beta hydrolase family protein [Nocardia sp. NPDC049149]|uniref:alpha/beta hydrolase family protein n=1 Tax=Nocardia sp. NPDC049149 TaxID=3364315 RepID=UPI00371E9103